MAIYSTDTYEIVSIMNRFKTTQDNVTTYNSSIIFVQGLPKENYAYVVPFSIDRQQGLVQEDYEVYDRLIANVIPIIDSGGYIADTLNISTNTFSFSNSAISPISMYSSAAQS
jgi:hypothetical protein